MKYEKYSFIGKMDKIHDDFNTYFEQIDAMKNLEKDSGELMNPEFYLQSIINRKRPETAVPCSVRNNRNNTFAANEQKLLKKPLRIKTSTIKRTSVTPIEAEFDKSLLFQDHDHDNDNDINDNDNENDNNINIVNEKNNFFGNFPHNNNKDNMFPGCYKNDIDDNDNDDLHQLEENDNDNIELNLNRNSRMRNQREVNNVNSNKKEIHLNQIQNKNKNINKNINKNEEVYSFRNNTNQKIGN